MKNELKFPAWTRPKYLSAGDHLALRRIHTLVKGKKYQEAMDYATMSCDTTIREEIPPDIWLKMGGTLLPAGLEKLRMLEEKRARKKGKKLSR